MAQEDIVRLPTAMARLNLRRFGVPGRAKIDKELPKALSDRGVFGGLPQELTRYSGQFHRALWQGVVATVASVALQTAKERTRSAIGLRSAR